MTDIDTPAAIEAPTAEADTPIDSPRSSLARIYADRAAVEFRVRDADAAEAKLTAAAPNDSEAMAELAALDSAASRELEAWARSGGVGEPPNSDADRREELLKRVTASQARARAIEGVKASLASERHEASRKLKALDESLAPTITDVLLEEADPLLARFMALAAEASTIASRIVELRTLVVGMAHATDGPLRTEMFARSTQFGEKAGDIRAHSSTPLETSEAHRTEWLALAARLRAGDVDAKLAVEA